MIDVKKLITGFLILATAAVCSGVIFSLASAPSTATQGTVATPITIGGVATDTDAGNAFLPSEVNELVAEAAPALASSSMMVSSTDPTNLTDDLATEFVNGIVTANPNGPTQTDSNGNPIIDPPDVNALATDLANATTTQTLVTPDWDVEAQSIPVNVIATTSPAAALAYENALNGIIDSHLYDNTQARNIVNEQSGNQSDSDVSYMEAQVKSALQDVASLEVPTSAKAYQESLLTELVYEKNLLALNDLAQTDPVKASLLFEQEDPKFAPVETNFLTQAEDFENMNVSLGPPPAQNSPVHSGNMVLSFLGNMFSIPEAHAQFAAVVSDPIETTDLETTQTTLSAQIAEEQVTNVEGVTQSATQNASLLGLLSSIHLQNMGQELEAILKNTLLQILKNTLIAIIQREVLTWIQGSGAPRFITNWGTQLVNAAQMSAINSINGLFTSGCVFPAFIGQEKITLNAFYKPGGNACANQFQAALGSHSFQQFYNNFANGGFVAFGASTLPSGNPYGDLFFNAQTVNFSYQNQQAASQVKTQASGGLTGTEYCPNFPTADPVNGEHTVCENPNGADYLQPAAGVCAAGTTPVVYGNNNLCPDGSQPLTNNPAAATGFALNSALDSSPKQVAAANDIVGVLNAVLNSLLLSMANTAVTAAGQLVNQGLTSLNASNITAGNTPPPANLAAAASSTAATAGTVAAVPLACSPISQTIQGPQSVTVTSLSGTTDASGTAGNGTTTVIVSSTAPTSLSATGGTTDSSGNPPNYTWTDTDGGTGTGALFSDTFADP
jgi:hypothetical protein